MFFSQKLEMIYLNLNFVVKKFLCNNYLALSLIHKRQYKEEVHLGDDFKLR